MKEFENWYNQFNNALTSKTEKKMQERAWEAALRWALEQEDWIGPDEGGSWGIDKWEIEEELNGENITT